MENTVSTTELLSLRVGHDWSLSVTASFWVGIILAGALVVYLIWRYFLSGHSLHDFEIDETELGIGTGRLKFRPNVIDRQVAYSIWVELSTRKIGLPIDFEHDLIAEVYDSWHTFFSVTRELIKTIPVQKVRNASTQKVIRLSIEVLNEGLRPHLTQWQARFRRWYEHELEKKIEDEVVAPQEIQTKFPQWDELVDDMEKVNRRLIHYRIRMNELVRSK